jgi:hypothetical protein
MELHCLNATFFSFAVLSACHSQPGISIKRYASDDVAHIVTPPVVSFELLEVKNAGNWMTGFTQRSAVNLRPAAGDSKRKPRYPKLHKHAIEPASPWRPVVY